jgi:hypothetical protein
MNRALAAEETCEFGAPDSEPDKASSSSAACTLALSSGLNDSFSSIANVVTEAMLFESKLVGFVEEFDRCVWESSKAPSFFNIPSFPASDSPPPFPFSSNRLRDCTVLLRSSVDSCSCRLPRESEISGLLRLSNGICEADGEAVAREVCETGAGCLDAGGIAAICEYIRVSQDAATHHCNKFQSRNVPWQRMDGQLLR